MSDKRIKAFTLVEMLVVLAIIAMLLGLSLPFTSAFGKGLRIKTTARAIVGVLRLARSYAITYRNKYIVRFDVDNNSYWIEDMDGKLIDKKYFLPSSVKFSIPGDEKKDPISFQDDRIVFYPSGAIEDPGGFITISDKQGGSRTISIIGSTGKISVD